MEEIYARNLSGQTLTVDATLLSGLEQFWADRSTNDVVVQKLANDATAGIRGNGSTDLGAATALTFGYEADSTTGNLAVDGGVQGANASVDLVTANGEITTLNITSTGDENTLAGID